MTELNADTLAGPQPLPDSDMRLVDAVRQRRSVRGYLQREVPDELLERVFDIARRAPSNCNVQPWKVYVACGELTARIREQMYERAAAGVTPNPDYAFREDFQNEYRQRQVQCAVALYKEMGIARDDVAGRRRAMLRNFRIFDAPHVAFVGMHGDFGTAVAVDVGMWAQTLMLTMVAFGIQCCPMATMRYYPDVVRDAFGIQDDTKILFGIGFGYEDGSVPANRTRTTRVPLQDNVVFRAD